MKKYLVLILGTLLVAASFTACGEEKTPVLNDDVVTDIVEETPETPEVEEVTFESVVAKSTEAAAGFDNMEVDINMDIDMAVVSGEERQEMNIDMAIESQLDGKTMFMSMVMNMLGQEMVTDSYVDLENYVMYVGMQDNWVKTPMDEATKAQYEKNGGTQMDLSVYSEYMTNGTLNEIEFEGVSCYEISGAVDYDMGEIVKEMGLDSMLGASGLNASMFDDAEPFILVMYVDKETYLPLYCYMDMTDFMSSIMSAALSDIYEQAGMEGITVEISSCTAEAFYYDYGNVYVEIPEEVLAAEEVSLDAE